jgi:hypothetical protein
MSRLEKVLGEVTRAHLSQWSWKKWKDDAAGCQRSIAASIRDQFPALKGMTDDAIVSLAKIQRKLDEHRGASSKRTKRHGEGAPQGRVRNEQEKKQEDA